MAKNKDGWHTILGNRVYVEQGKVIRAVVQDSNGSLVPAWPYWPSKYGGWDNCSGLLSVSAFRRRVKNDTVILS